MNEDLVEETLNVVRDALPTSLAMASKFGAVRLVLADHLTRTVSVPPKNAGRSPPRSHGQKGAGRINPGAAAGLVIAFFVLIVCAVIMVFYCRNDANKKKKQLMMKKKQGKYRSSNPHRNNMNRHRPTRRERELMAYFDHNNNNDGSLTNTLPETNSDTSDRASWRREALEKYWYDQNQPREKNHKIKDKNRKLSKHMKAPKANRPHRHQQQQRHRQQQRQQQQTLHEDTEQPVVLEFSNSFNPERDRFIRDMEEESSAPPSYMFDPNAPPDFMFVYDQYERYDPYAEYAEQQNEEEDVPFEISEIQII